MMNLFTQVVRARCSGKCTQWMAYQPERCFQTSHRSLKQVLTKTMRIKHEDYYKRIDNVPNEYEMIYKLPLHYTMNMGKIVTAGTTILIPSAYIYNNYTGTGMSDANFVSTIAVDQGDLFWLIGGLAITSFLLYRCCEIATLRIYRHEQSYVAMVPSIIPRRNIQLRFEQGQVTEGGSKLLSKIFEGVFFRIKGRTQLLIPDRFRKGSDLFQMLHADDSKKYKL